MDALPRFDLNGQVALVAGAARGLGRAISLALAAAGADVALGLRDVNAVGGLSAEIRGAGSTRLVSSDGRDVNRPDYSCGGRRRACISGDSTFWSTTLASLRAIRPRDVREEDFDFTLAVNLKGTFFASQAAGRVMIRQMSGRIINMSSQAGFAALPAESVYCMTKAGIAHLTKCLAVEWGLTTSP